MLPSKESKIKYAKLQLVLVIGLLALLGIQTVIWIFRGSNETKAIKIEQAKQSEIYASPNLAQKSIEPSVLGSQTNRKVEPARLNSEVVASKKSKSKLYHFLWCPGAKQIKEENKIVFESEQSAIQTGYKLAANCKR